MSETKSTTSIRHADGKLRYFVARTCEMCGETQTIPKSTKTPTPICKKCSQAMRRGVPRPARMRGEVNKCRQCERPVYRRPSDGNRQFCSSKCANEFKRRYTVTSRQCQHCGQAFLHTPRPNSNSPGTYCSLQCRNAAYVGQCRGKPARNLKSHRPGWASISRRYRLANNFCSCCGKTGGRLSVHHVDPYWRSKNNDDQNLVTLCPKCHGKLEMLSEKLAVLPEPQRIKAAAIIQARLHDLWHIHQGRRLLKIPK